MLRQIYKKSSRRLPQTAVLTTFALSTPLASAASAIDFSDNFDDGSVVDWVKSTNYGGTTALTTRTDSVLSPGHAHFACLDAPPGGSNPVVRASDEFVASLAADYLPGLSACSSSCQGCTISYDILVDGVLLSRKFQPHRLAAKRSRAPESIWMSYDHGFGPEKAVPGGARHPTLGGE